MAKILFLIAHLCSRGAEHQMVTVAGLLKNDGHDVSFLCYHPDNFFEPVLIKQGISVRRLPPMGYIRRMMTVRHIIRNGGYDVVVSFLLTDNFLNDFSAVGRHRWKVITGERSSKESHLTSFRGRIFAWFQRYSDYIVCNSKNAMDMWLKHYPKYKDKLLVIYNNVKLPEINSSYRLRRDGKTHIVLAGAYAYVKDPQCLISAISLLPIEKRGRIVVDWYGKIDANTEATQIYSLSESLIKRHHLENTIFLHDATHNIADRMNEADVVALVSRWEGLPNSICEGMTIGKPILMTCVSDYSTLIDDSNGWLCRSGDSESIAKALSETIASSDNVLIAKGYSSKKRAMVLFSEENVLKDWLKIIE